MEGRIGIGAPFEGTPFVHVARLVAAGRGLVDPPTSPGCAGAGDGRGDNGRVVVVCWGTAGALSRATKERRSHEEVFDVRLGETSCDSFVESPDCFRFNSLEDVAFGRSGSTASW